MWKPVIKGVCVAVIAGAFGYDCSMPEWWAIIVPMNIMVNMK